MSRNISEEQWFKLDNAAKIFPANTGLRDTKVIRFTCKMRDAVDGEILKKAVDLALEGFPHYRSVLKKGLFWYYFQESDIPPVVEEEQILPYTTLYDGGNRQNLLFRVTYFNRRINLEVYHAISDGTGVMEFFKALLYYYVRDKYADEVPEDFVPSANASIAQKMDDSYKHYYVSEKNKITIPESNRAYKIKGLKMPEYRLRITELTMPVDKLLALSKENKTTLTVFLAALMTVCINEARPKGQVRPIMLSIPVNLRKFFPSESARNFFAVFSIKYKFKKTECYSEELIKNVIESYNTQFKENLTQENMESTIYKMLALENNKFIKAVPLFIKNPVMKHFGSNNEKQITAAFSNIGIIKLDEPLTRYVDNFVVSAATNKLQVTLTTYNGKLTVTLTSPFVSTDIEMEFARKLSDLGIDVTVTSNNINE